MMHRWTQTERSVSCSRESCFNICRRPNTRFGMDILFGFWMGIQWPDIVS